MVDVECQDTSDVPRLAYPERLSAYFLPERVRSEYNRDKIINFRISH